MSKVTLYHANWCGHCVQFQPEWRKIKNELDKKGIMHEEYEETSNKSIMEKNQINGYPTIRITKNGKTSDYKGQRNMASIVAAVTGQKETRPHVGGGMVYYKKYLKYKKKYLNLKKKN
jgi:protein disulfide-isomerase A1